MPPFPPPPPPNWTRSWAPPIAAGGSARDRPPRAGKSGPVGQPADGPYLGDLGFRGADWAKHWHGHYGAVVLTKAAYPTQAGRHWFSGLRQVIETINGWLEERFGLHFPRARTAWGLQTRLAAKLAAFNLAVHFNHLQLRAPFTAVEVSWA